MTDGPFTLPTAPLGPWDQLSDNEKAWIEMIRVISGGRDPMLTLERTRLLTDMLDMG